MADDKTEAAITKQAEALALAFDNPEALARRLAEWIKENYPEKVAQAYWITAERERDKGIQVEIVRLPWTWAQKLRLGVNGLIGGKTIGANLSSVVWQDLAGRWSVFVGLGAVTRYAELLGGGKWKPVATVAVRYKW